MGTSRPIDFRHADRMVTGPGYHPSWSGLSEPSDTAEPPAATACAADSGAAAEALERLVQLDAMVENLPPAGPLQSASDALNALLRSDCFRLAAESPRQPRADSATALLEWWRSGGRGWLGSYLDRPVAGPIEAPQPQVVVPPDTLRTLDLVTRPDHPLARYLCRPGDALCGAETRGWRLRAESAFQNHRSRGLHTLDQDPPFDYTADHAERVAAACAGSGQDAAVPAPERYRRWRTCIEQRRFTRLALPLGAVRAPVDGWLIVEGRRGHYEFCDSVRAFDLKSGAAFLWDSCSGLALRPDGSVDRARTDAGRDQRVRRGTVGVDAIREAAWMLLLRGETREAQLTEQWFPLPSGLQPVPLEPPVAPDEASVVALPWSSAQTTLTWRLVLPDHTGFTGDLTWPASYDAAEDHSAALLEIAEAGLVEGCAGRPPRPSLLQTSSTSPLNELLDDAEERLRERFGEAAGRWQAEGSCRTRRRR